jgi:4'-phosphopantetheinyl transferase
LDRHLTQVWLAGSEAAAAADRNRLDAADRERSARLAGCHKEAEWLASRALRQRVAPAPGAATSLSHAAGHAAFAVAPAGSRIGVDLEAVRPRDVLRLARFAFAPAEAAQLETLPGEAALRHFYLLWTLKEACAKALGLPLLAALRECSFISEHQHWRASLPAGDRWSAGVWAPHPGLVLSVVVLGPAADTAGWCCREWPGAPADWPLLAGLGDFRAAP